MNTRSIISRYNHFSGKLVNVSSLKKFVSSLDGDHGDASSIISTIKERVQKAIDTAEKKDLTVFRAQITPVELEKKKALQAKEKPLKSPKPKKTAKERVLLDGPKRRSHGPVSAASLVHGKTNSKSFRVIDLEPRFKKDLVRLYNDTHVMIWGMPGEGKTGYCLQLANSLAKHSKLKVLYVVSEEYGRSVFEEKLQALKAAGTPIDDKDLFFVGSLSQAGDLNKYDVIFLDSINHMGLKLKDYIKLSERTPGIMKVSIVQTTKDGDFRGGKDWEHEMDIAGEVVSRKLRLRKNRLDPNLADKRRKHEMESRIAREREKKTVREKVKSLSAKDKGKDKDKEKEELSE